MTNSSAASRVLVVAVLDADDPDAAERLVAAGADMVERAGAPPPEGVVVAADLKQAAQLVRSSGKPVLLSADDLPTIAVAVTIGCRLIRTRPELVRAARRVCDVLAAVVEAGP